MKFVMDSEAKGSVRTRNILFSDLWSGDVFMNEDKEIFIRSEVFRSEFEDYNAVNLDTGVLAFFEEDEKVWKYEGSVVFNPSAFNNKVVIS